MSVTLTTDQFSALINSVNVLPKKKTKSLITEYVNAQNFEDFLVDFKHLKVSRLQSLSLVNFVVETIQMNLDHLEETEYPFVCANKQTRVFYYKSNDKWIKGTEFIKVLHSKIVKQAYAELLDDFNELYKEDVGLNDDEEIEKRYSSSKHSIKQEIIMNLCVADKMSYEELFKKILTKLGVLLKTSFDIVK